MPRYVDSFVIPVPKRNVAAYRRLARIAATVWMECGALAYREAIADQAPYGKRTSFPRSVKANNGETVIVAYILYKTRAHRDRVNKKAMKDPRLAKYMDPKKLPFDARRMFWGGFRTIVER